MQVEGTPQGHTFGDRIRMARERMRSRAGQRWTQGDLAKALNVERNTISRWENSGILPKDPSIIAALGRVLHVSVDWLLAGLGEPEEVATVGAVHERPQHPYGSEVIHAESLPTAAADIVLRYLDRMVELGCNQQQVQDAERLLVYCARNTLSRRSFDQRDAKEVIGDVDAAWDFIVRVLRRQGIRP